MKAQGQTHIYPDNVDTDVIIPARYLNTSDPKELASHCMCDIDADFVNKVKPGDIIVIPPHTFHWFDNTMNEEEFKIFTLWPEQEQNEVYFVRREAWGTSMKYVDENYLEKRRKGTESK